MSNVIQILIFISTLAAVLAALFGSRFQKYFFSPEFAIIDNDDRKSHKYWIDIVQKNRLWFRVCILNSGTITSHNTIVKVMEIYINGRRYNPLDFPFPKTLCWGCLTFLGEKDLRPNEYEYLDVCFISPNKKPIIKFPLPYEHDIKKKIHYPRIDLVSKLEKKSKVEIKFIINLYSDDLLFTQTIILKLNIRKKGNNYTYDFVVIERPKSLVEIRKSKVRSLINPFSKKH